MLTTGAMGSSRFLGYKTDALLWN